MAQPLKSVPARRVRLAALYSTGQLALILGVAHSTANRLIDQRVIHGFRMPGRRPDRRITHGSLIRFVKTHPQFKYALDQLLGYTPADDFPEGTEPAPPPMFTTPSAPPRSPERPRSIRRGKIPLRSQYPLTEVAFALGLSRRTVWAKVRARELFAIRAPSTGPSPWRWLVPRPVLLTFIDRHPSYSYALGRIEGCESGVAASDPTARTPALKMKTMADSP
jgi:hypothetical protein